MDDQLLVSLSEIREIQSLAQTGANYSKDAFDQERYKRLLELASNILAKGSNESSEKIANWCFSEIGYATPKLAVRGLVMSDDKILMVQERSNGLWALPGGWADVNHSAAESTEKEVWEETGLNVKATHLLAFYDKLKHDHPPHWPHTHVAFFLCEIIGGTLCDSTEETSKVAYFSINELPELCRHRGTVEQIRQIFYKTKNSLESPVLFD